MENDFVSVESREFVHTKGSKNTFFKVLVKMIFIAFDSPKDSVHEDK